MHPPGWPATWHNYYLVLNIPVGLGITGGRQPSGYRLGPENRRETALVKGLLLDLDLGQTEAKPVPGLRGRELGQGLD